MQTAERQQSDSRATGILADCQQTAVVEPMMHFQLFKRDLFPGCFSYLAISWASTDVETGVVVQRVDIVLATFAISEIR